MTSDVENNYTYYGLTYPSKLIKETVTNRYQKETKENKIMQPLFIRMYLIVNINISI